MSGGLSRLASNPVRMIVGNPENRRVTAYQQSAASQGHAPPRCVSWQSVFDHPQAAIGALSTADVVRIDSPGENEAVLHQLIQTGGGQRRLLHGELALLREQAMGLRCVLETLSACQTQFQNPPGEIIVMFDKWASHSRFIRAGVARPEAFLAPGSLPDFHQFRAAFNRGGYGRMFLKPRYGSSGSGVCAYRWSGDREMIIAPIELQRHGEDVLLFNSLRMRKYLNKDVYPVLATLLPQGMIAERWISKSKLDGESFDLRIVVIAGEARHIVVRQSHHPMTNLHLGNQRGNLDAVRKKVGDRTVAACLDLAVAADACFAGSLYSGVDVIVPEKGEPVVCEINAFGDLLPSVIDRGETTYQAIFRASDAVRNSV